MKKILYLLFWVAGAQAMPLQEQSEAPVLYLPDIEPITVNGLIAGKAAVMINGQIHLLSEGEKVGNVSLISADENSALLSIGDQQKRFYLHEAKLANYSDDFINYSGDVTAEQQDILGASHLAKAESHIINVELLKQDDNRVTYRIEYFYNASHGEHVTMSASTQYQGRSTGYSAHGYTKLEVGRNLVDIDVFLNSKAPAESYSDAIRFEIIGGEKLKGSHQVLNKVVALEKVWTKDAFASEPQGSRVLGNAQWQTLSPSR